MAPRHSSRFAAVAANSTGERQTTCTSSSAAVAGESRLQSAKVKSRGQFVGYSLDKRTRNGTKKIEISFIPDRMDIQRLVAKDLSVNELSLWLGRIAKDILITPRRTWNTVTEVEYQRIMAKINHHFVFIGNQQDQERFYKFCDNSMAKSVRQWRHKLKKYYEDEWIPATEDQRKIPEGFTASDWDELMAIYDSEECKEKSTTNSANRSKLKIIHTTGTTSFAEFEYRQCTVAEDGTLSWPTASDAWMLEHTKKNAEGDLVYVDPVSAEIHEKIIEVEITQQTQQSVCGSSDSTISAPMYPTDVVFTQHHNRRTGRGSGFLPLPTSKKK